MDFIELMKQTRSTRRFQQDRIIEIDKLETLTEAASLCPSAMNKQPMKYILSNKEPSNKLIFDCLIWAPYIKEWAGPIQGQRPAAYLVMMLDTHLIKKADLDAGIQAQSIMLCARSMGIAGCIMEKVDFKRLAKELEIPEEYEIQLVLALGYPDEKIVREGIVSDEAGGHDIRFYHGTDGTHHVPKRLPEELIYKVL